MSTAALAKALCAASLLLLVVGIALSLLAHDSLTYHLPFIPMLLTLGVLGALIVGRQPGNVIGWLFLATGLVLGITSGAGGYAAFALSDGRDLPGGVAAAWLTSWLTRPALFGIPPLMFLLFPNGRLLSKRWSPVLWVLVLSLVSVAAVGATEPGDLSDTTVSGIPNPAAATGRLIDTLANVGWLGAIVGLLLAIASLVVRYRRSTGAERLQMRWLVSAAWVFLFTFALAVGSYETRYEALGNASSVGLLAIPLATGLAILRYRLYDIDVVINRTLVYGALTATLGLVYLVSVLLLRLALSPVTGESDLAVAASTLAVAGLFRPLRTRIQTVVDRRFYRRRYDAALTLQSFGGRLRQEVDLATVSDALQSVVRETVQPTHVSLWLRGAVRGPAVTIPERPRPRKVSP
jgi:hypothetical protein